MVENGVDASYAGITLVPSVCPSVADVLSSIFGDVVVPINNIKAWNCYCPIT